MKCVYAQISTDLTITDLSILAGKHGTHDAITVTERYKLLNMLHYAHVTRILSVINYVTLKVIKVFFNIFVFLRLIFYKDFFLFTIMPFTITQAN